MILLHDDNEDRRLPRREHASPLNGGLIRELHQMLMEIGVTSERDGDLQLALKLYKGAIATNPNNALAWYNYGDVLLALGRQKEAIVALRKAVELAPTVPLFHYDLGLAFYKSGKFEEARQEFELIVSKDALLKRASSHLGLSAITNLALCQDQLGDPLRGMETLQPTLRVAEDILFNLARLNLRGKMPAKALRMFQAAALLSPTNEPIIHGIGSALMALGRHKEAVAHLRHATRLDRQCEFAWCDLGITLSILKKNKEALFCFKRTLVLNPRHAWAHYCIACLDALANRKEAAFCGLERAITYGFCNLRYLQREKDLKSLKHDKRWRELTYRLARDRSARVGPRI